MCLTKTVLESLGRESIKGNVLIMYCFFHYMCKWPFGSLYPLPSLGYSVHFGISWKKSDVDEGGNFGCVPLKAGIISNCTDCSHMETVFALACIPDQCILKVEFCLSSGPPFYAKVCIILTIL